MTKDEMQKVRDALLNSSGHHPACDLFTLNHNGNKYLPCDCGGTESLALLDLALAAEPQQPVAWRDKSALPGYPSYEYNRQGIGEPLYTAPVAAQREWVESGAMEPAEQQERRRKALAEPDQWKPYLKDGETPFERFTRERKDLDALLELYKQEKDKYAFVLRLCTHISGCTVEQVDAQIVKVMSENKWEDV